MTVVNISVSECFQCADDAGARLTSHDVVTVSDETEADSQGDDSDLPQRNICLGADSLASGPSRVHGSPDTNGVANIVSTVGEGCSAGSDDLNEGVEILDLVGVLGCICVNTLHAAAFRSSEHTDLRTVDIVRHAVQSTDDDLGREADEGSLHVVKLVDGSSSELIVVQSAHGPAQGRLLLSQFGVVFLAGVGKQEAVGFASVLLIVNRRGSLLRGSLDIHGGDLLGVVVEHGGISLCVGSRALDVTGVLYDGVVGNLGKLGIRRGSSAEERGTLDHVPDLEGVVLLDDLAVDEGDEEQGREEEQTESDSESDAGDVPTRLVGQAKSRRSLVDDRQGADGASDEEEDRGGPDSPAHRILADVDGVLDQREDDRSEDSGCDRRHAEAGEDGSKAGATVPPPFHLAGADCGNTNTCDRRYERVCRRNVGRVARAPHDPDSGTSGRAGEGEKLDAGVAVECSDGDNSVLDGGGCPGSYSEGTGDFKDQAEDHGLLVGDGAGGDTGGPGVGDIVCGRWLTSVATDRIMLTYWHRCCMPRARQRRCRWRRRRCIG
jgi:hypothetical protein